MTDSVDDTTDEKPSESSNDPKAEPDQQTAQEIEKDREERLDPDNRPANAEVDNTERTFDVDRGQFTDTDEYDESEPAPFFDQEDPNTSEGDESQDEQEKVS